ncbi:MAG: restriction endonuclease subunit S [Robiginitomaculum sp.]
MNEHLENGWQHKTLGEFIDFKNGVNADKSAYGSGMKFVNVMDVFQGEFLTHDEIRGSVEISEKQKRGFSVIKGDILLNRTSETREDIACATIYMDDTPATFGGFVIRGRQFSSLLTPEYSGYCFQSSSMRKELIRRGQGAIRSNIGQKDLNKVSILIPPKPQQNKIATTLLIWDKAIEKTEALITAKQKQFEWLMSAMIRNQQENLVKLGDLKGKITIEKGKALRKSEIHSGDIPVIAGGKTSPYFHNKSTHNIPCITASASGANAGYIWFHNSPIWASDCNVVYSESISTRYLFFALKAKQQQIYSLQSGGAQPHVYAKDLHTIKVPLPSHEEQLRISASLDNAAHEIKTLKALADKYREQKRGLMQKLLSGKCLIAKKEQRNG